MNLSTSADASELSSALRQAASSDPQRPVEVIVALRTAVSPTDALGIVEGSSSLLAFYHGWKGLDTDYVGGYELSGMATAEAIEDYRAAYEAMLRQTLANIDSSSSMAAPEDAAAWDRARQDALARLQAFLANDIPVVAVRVIATGQVLVSWTEARSSWIRRIDGASASLRILLPWR
ncbi:MAG TPA: hypothetical protein VNO86_08470 [Candidatus Binatia bacterium]|nr:hypothetical protein [Candidatus Binatia bacterium]